RPSFLDGRDAHPTFKSGSYLILIPKLSAIVLRDFKLKLPPMQCGPSRSTKILPRNRVSPSPLIL
ncbi:MULTISPECIES: hypothetical protein, partial [unclassified Microcoleus]|uniref:hypothetical protein n=1 Tax=unclassified Microcoleus TaxID=2642155 RepID=UPI002FD03FB6